MFFPRKSKCTKNFVKSCLFFKVIMLLLKQHIRCLKLKNVEIYPNFQREQREKTIFLSSIRASKFLHRTIVFKLRTWKGFNLPFISRPSTLAMGLVFRRRRTMNRQKPWANEWRRLTLSAKYLRKKERERLAMKCIKRSIHL